MTTNRLWVVQLAVAFGLVTGCGGGSGGAEPDRTVVVFAASSLTDVFSEMSAAFENANPGVEVLLSAAGSSSLREQIIEGAPADVFASANEAVMDQVVEAGEVVGDARVFATNEMIIAVPAGNPAGITGLVDFTDEDRLIGLCAVGVPCGDLARLVLNRAGVEPSVDTEEPDVRALLTKLEADELDGGIVYATDVVASTGRVDGIPVGSSVNVMALLPIAPLRGGENAEGAAAFVGFVLSPEGQAILAGYGFGAP